MKAFLSHTSTDKDLVELVHKKLENKNILLIDDVYASGETIKEIIKIFKGFEFNYNLEILVFCYRNHIFN